MWRYWISEACYWLLIAFAIAGCGLVLIILGVPLSPTLCLMLAVPIIYGINAIGEHAARGCP